MYTLLVIDMQAGFLRRFDGYRNNKERDRVIAGVKQAVVKAIADGAEIIDVNYVGRNGPTIPEIADLWRGYKKYFKTNVKRVFKECDGGGEEVMEAKPQHDELRACGINAGACVHATVSQLRFDYDKTVYVVQDAIANAWGGIAADIRYFEDILI